MELLRFHWSSLILYMSYIPELSNCYQIDVLNFLLRLLRFYGTNQRWGNIKTFKFKINSDPPCNTSRSEPTIQFNGFNVPIAKVHPSNGESHHGTSSRTKTPPPPSFESKKKLMQCVTKILHPIPSHSQDEHKWQSIRRVPLWPGLWHWLWIVILISPRELSGDER